MARTRGSSSCCSPQLRGMLRKNWILTKRNPRELAREILLPVVYLAIMIILRSVLKGSVHPAEVPALSDGGWNSKWWSLENVGFWFFAGRGNILPDNITIGFVNEAAVSCAHNGSDALFLREFMESFQRPLQYQVPEGCFGPPKNATFDDDDDDDRRTGNHSEATPSSTTFPPLPPPGPGPPPLLFCPQLRCFDTAEALEAAAVRNDSSLYFGVVFSALPPIEELLLANSQRPSDKDSGTQDQFHAPDVAAVSYTIRLNHTLVVGEVSQAETYRLQYTDIASSGYQSPTPTNQTRQWAGLFSAIQLAVDDALINLYSGSTTTTTTTTSRVKNAAAPQPSFVETSVYLSASPTPSFVLDASEMILAFLVPAWLSNVFLLQIRGSLQRILEDKQSKIRVGLTMIGLNEAVYWFSWAILIIGKGLIIVVILTLATHFGDIFPRSNPVILLVLFFLFSAVCCAYCFLATAFFSKARLGAIVGYLIFLFSMLGGIALEYVDSVPLKMGLAVWPPVAFFEVLYLTLLADGVGMPGVQFANFLDPNLTSVGVSFGYFVGVLGAAVVWLCLLAAYANQTVPNEWGTTKPWNFPCLACCGNSRRRRKRQARGSVLLQEELLESAAGVAGLSDGDSEGVSLRITHLRKVFGAGGCCKKRQSTESEDDGNSASMHQGTATSRKRTTQVTAVKDLSLDIFHGQITVLLGHNGAGKSTTIGMLTGLLKPSSGDAEIYGHSIVDDLESVRPLIGVCPQHDVLFDKLTVREHIQFYANVKGQPVDDEFEAKTNKWLEQLDLLDKSNDLSTNLSGGQKRKLSTIIALLGDRTRLIFLDEPSSGMDPWARRLLWGVLDSAKANKTIILTTHYLDEADILGDQIAVMSRGRLQVTGSGLALKSRFGLGYHLIVAVKLPPGHQQPFAAEAAPIAAAQPSGDYFADDPALRPIDDAIFRLIPGSSRETGEEDRYEATSVVSTTHDADDDDDGGVTLTLSYTLPLDSTAHFSKLFDRLNEMSCSGGAPASSEGMSSASKQSATSHPGNVRRPDDGSSMTVLRKEPGEARVLEYGLCMSTLEEVFLRLSREQEAAEAEEIAAQAHAHHPPSNGSASSPQTTVAAALSKSNPQSAVYVSPLKIESAIAPSLRRQLGALLRKRSLSSRRDRKSLFIQIFAPVMLVGISYAFQFIGNVDLGSSLAPVPLGLNTLDHEHYEAGQYGTSFPVSWDPNGCQWSNRVRSGASDANFRDAQRIVSALTNDQLLASYNDMPVASVVNGSIAGLNDVLSRNLNSTSSVLGNRPAVGAASILCHNMTLYSDFERQLYEFELLMNLSMLQSVPVSISVLNSARLTNALSAHPAVARQASTLALVTNVTYAPFPLTSASVGIGIFIAAQTQALYVASGFTIVAGMIASQIVQERELGVKSMQLMMGIDRVMYWLSFFIFDFVLYLIPATLSLGLLSILNPAAFGGDQLPMIALTAFLYGFAIIFFAYVVSFIFQKHTTAQTFTLLICTLGVTILQGISFALSYPTLNVVQWGQDLYNYIALIFPPYAFATALTNLAYKTQCPPGVPEEACHEFVRPAASWDVCGAPWAFMGISAAVFFLVLIAIEYKHILSGRSKVPSLAEAQFDTTAAAGGGCGGDADDDVTMAHLIQEDSDVQRERQRVRAAPQGTSSIQIVGLRKKYSNGTLAVRELDISIAAGTCFGLLGPNGAGKTSTIKIITGFQPPTSGTCFLHGFDIKTQVAAAQRIMGFCPQHDALLPLLTGRESLQFYGACKGIDAEQLDACVDRVLLALGLQAHGNKLTKQYSGGNKRKLSLAIAMLGNPRVVLLDEPSSGMDPGARRNMWNLIKAERRARPDMSMILTTHLMEEADELCSRIGILVGGRLACLGTAQHLKNRYSRGYSLEIKLQDDNDSDYNAEARLKSLIVRLEAIAGTAELTDWHKRLFKYQFKGAGAKHELERQTTAGAGASAAATPASASIPTSVVNTTTRSAPQGMLSQLFACIEEHRQEVGVETYSLSQTTLEQVFIGFAEKQNLVDQFLQNKDTMPPTTDSAGVAS